MTTRRQRATTPEERAENLSDPTYSASGLTYIAVVMREDDKRGRVPYYSNPDKCDHGHTMCPTWDCIESWSVDHRVELHMTVAGRQLAVKLGIDPKQFSEIDRSGIEILKVEDFMVPAEVG